MVLEQRLVLALVLALAGHFFLLSLPGMRISAPVAPSLQPQRVTIRLTAPPVAVPVSRPQPRPVEPQVKPPPRQPVRRAARVPARKTTAAPVPPAPLPVARPVEPVRQPPAVDETTAPKAEPAPAAPQPRPPLPAPAAVPAPAGVPEVTLAYPKYRQNPTPRYPAAARRRGWQGTVLLEVFVNDAGRVEKLRLARSSGHSLLDRAASKTVRAWHFVPGRRGDKKTAMWVRVPVRFELRQAR